MNDNDDEPPEEIILAIREGARRGPIPTVAYRCICDSIEPDRETATSAKLEQPLKERWAALTTPLRLAGGPAMRTRAGRFASLDAVTRAMPWAESLVEEIARQSRIQLALGRPWVRIEPLLLVGPPGVGKTWLARRLAKALGLDSAVLELGNTSDDRALSGTARGWSNTVPGWPLVVMANTRTANPLLILDGLDKAGGSERAGHAHRRCCRCSSPRRRAPGMINACSLLVIPAS